MKNLRHISFLVMVCAFFISCKKNREPEPVTFSGKITDVVTGQPVSGVTVKIKLQQAANNNVFNTGFNTVATTSTDVSGNYSVTFTPEDPITYKIEVSKNLYFGREIQIANEEVPPGSTKTTNFSVDPIGWFRINIVNANPNDVDDIIVYQNTSEGSGCSSCCNNLTVSMTGMAVDTTFICQRIAYPTINFSWIVTKNGNTNQFSNSVNAIAGDTVVYNLNY